jgi:transposase
VALKLVYLAVSHMFAWARLAALDSTAKDVEILILRHQLAVAQRQDPQVARKLTWADRAWPALLAGLVPKHRIGRIRWIVTPETLIRWHRDLLRRSWARRSARPAGRPRTHRNIKALALRMARENPSWGYRRIHGELAGLGIRVAPSTVWEILKRAGIDPAPRRDAGPTWAAFLRSQAEAILACDFVVVDLLDGSKADVLAAIEHATRRVRILGATLHPNKEWVVQQARNLLMDLDDAGVRVRFMVHDRDATFCEAFDAVFAAAGIAVIRTGIRGAPPELHPGTLVPQPARRTHRPNVHLEHPAPHAAATGLQGVLQGVLQRSQTSPLPRPSSAVTPTAGQRHRSRPTPRPTTRPRRRHPPRIPPGRIDYRHPQPKTRTNCLFAAYSPRANATNA